MEVGARLKCEMKNGNSKKGWKEWAYPTRDEKSPEKTKG